MTTRYILQIHAETALQIVIDNQEITMTPGDKIRLVWEAENTSIKVKNINHDNN